MIKRTFSTLLLTAAAACTFAANAAQVKVAMNKVSTTMSLTNLATNETVDVGEPTSNTYTFEAPAGRYLLTGYGTDGATKNGTIEVTVEDSDEEQTITIITVTAYATNSGWTVDTDYTIDATVSSREGETQTITIGNSVTAGRKTFLALNGNSYYATFTPNEAHAAEGYMALYRSATLTANVNATGVIPMGEDYTITLPKDAEFSLGLKFAHFVNFTPMEPTATEVNGDVKTLTYHLAQSQVYNYRTWRAGGLTQAGYFTMAKDAAKRPTLAFTDADYEQFGATTIKHDVQWNGGYETGDIFVNVNERGFLQLSVGDQFKAHAMRSWQLTDTQTNNYFMEPDFHYTVINLDGTPSTGVIEIDNADTTTSPWSTIKAVGKGTVIVLVTYDAIGANYYNANGVKTTYMGGEYWSAIWPENTAAYVVSVGETASSVTPNIHINEAYNDGAKKRAGENVDAEHDVFYYLDTEAGATYTFTPQGAASVEMARPVIGERMATYSGFSADGVTANEDGSYTLLLTEGRQIVRLTDAAGNSTYQVLTAKPCHLEISNTTRAGSNIIQPGDQVKVQFSGLRHPANKLAGIYNMSAYVTYNGTPNGTSLILSANQYTFGSVASAQAVTLTIPENYDVDANPVFTMNEGVIQVNGYGDPIGAHRDIDPIAGRSPNFTAVAHKTYFGVIPAVSFKVTAAKNFNFKVECNASDANYTVSFNGTELTPNDDGTYTGSYGTYSVVAAKKGYRCYRGSFSIPDDAEGDQIFSVEMIADENATWDGVTTTEPTTDAEGNILISTGEELAWFAAKVIAGDNATTAVLTADIDLGDYDWTPISTFHGTFDGNGHTISGLYINQPTLTKQGLFGECNGATISDLTVDGTVTAKSVAGGVIGYATASTIDRCANLATVTTSSTSAGGIIGQAQAATEATRVTITNCYNLADITASGTCGGIVGSATDEVVISNVYSIGKITGKTNVGACAGGAATPQMTNAYAIEAYTVTTNHTLVTEAQMASGEVAYLLGDAFGQFIGEDLYPVLDGPKVFHNEETDTYYNEGASGISSVEVSAATPAEYFDLNGRRLAAPQRGVNIVRLTDGTTVKLLVK